MEKCLPILFLLFSKPARKITLSQDKGVKSTWNTILYSINYCIIKLTEPLTNSGNSLCEWYHVIVCNLGDLDGSWRYDRMQCSTAAVIQSLN